MNISSNMYNCYMIFGFIVTWIFEISAGDDKCDLKLARIFRTPKDFSRVNFDHLEILERNNFDPESENKSCSTLNHIAKTSESLPKSIANAQVMLRFGGDNIRGRNKIETPDKMCSQSSFNPAISYLPSYYNPCFSPHPLIYYYPLPPSYPYPNLLQYPNNPCYPYNQLPINNCGCCSKGTKTVPKVSETKCNTEEQDFLKYREEKRIIPEICNNDHSNIEEKICTEGPVLNCPEIIEIGDNSADENNSVQRPVTDKTSFVISNKGDVYEACTNLQPANKVLCDQNYNCQKSNSNEPPLPFTIEDLESQESHSEENNDDNDTPSKIYPTIINIDKIEATSIRPEKTPNNVNYIDIDLSHIRPSQKAYSCSALLESYPIATEENDDIIIDQNLTNGCTSLQMTGSCNCVKAPHIPCISKFPTDNDALYGPRQKKSFPENNKYKKYPRLSCSSYPLKEINYRHS